MEICKEHPAEICYEGGDCPACEEMVKLDESFEEVKKQRDDLQEKCAQLAGGVGKQIIEIVEKLALLKVR